MTDCTQAQVLCFEPMALPFECCRRNRLARTVNGATAVPARGAGPGLMRLNCPPSITR